MVFVAPFGNNGSYFRQRFICLKAESDYFCNHFISSSKNLFTLLLFQYGRKILQRRKPSALGDAQGAYGTETVTPPR